MKQTKRKRVDDDENDCELDTSERMDTSAYMSDEEGGIRIEEIFIPPPPKLISNNQENGIRLIIHKIINTNFKSYGGTTVLGPFNKNFNAIVGPNGSGKSNVIDSMLFVFGYRASKIRSKKMSVLLHKSEKYPNVQSCTVAVQFILIKDIEGDPEAYEEIPNSKIEVARTVHSDNTSYYTLNGSRVQYKEVASLLRKHGIDLDHNRFLILQGEVEQISLMKPKAPNEHETGMLEYLEDIIGTTRYKIPLEQLEEKIETLSEIRMEKLNRVKLAEREKEDLKEPMSEAVEFLKLENNITRNKNFIYQRMILETEEKINKNQEEQGEIQKVCDEMNEKLSETNQEKKKLELEFNSKNEKHDKLSKQKDKLTEEYDKINNRDLALKENIVSMVTKRKKGKEQLKIEQKKLEDLEKIPEKNQAKVEELKVRIEQLSEEIKALEEKKQSLLSSLGTETAKFSEEKEKIQIKLAPLKAEYDELKSAYQVIDSQLKIAQTKEQSELKNLDKLKKQFEENKQTLKEKPKLISDLQNKIKMSEKSLNDAHKDLQKAQGIENAKIQEIRNIKDQIEESKSSMRASKSRNQIIEALMRQKRDGKMPGLFGRLGDLGAIDLKYDVAISTACGPLDNIVVDTVNTGKWGVDFLKQNGIGRATFIPLEKQEYLREKANTKIKTPENVHRLFDLIKVEDERVKTAFYYALRDTLVANDLEQASRIAYGERRWRVVTLKGELIETSGTMSGGGKTVFRGRMGQSVTVHSKAIDPEKIVRMEKTLGELEHETREQQNIQIKLNDQIRTLSGQLEKMKIELNKNTYTVDSIQNTQSQLAEQIKKQEKLVKNSASNPEVIKKLEAQVVEKKKAYEKAEEKVNVLQTKVEDINKEIKQITDKKMGGIDKKLTETKQIFEKCKKEVSKLTVEISKSQRQKVLCNDKIKDLETERIAFEKSLQEMQAERQEIEKTAADFIQKIENITEDLKSEEKCFSGARKAIDKLTKQINEIKSEKIDIDVKLKDAEKKLNESKRELNHIKLKLKELTLQEIPDETVEELQTYTPEELFEDDLKHITSQLKVQEEQLKNSKPNLTAIQEYKKKVAIYLDRVQELDEITEKRNMLRNSLEDARKRRLDEFHVGFKSISSKLKEMYQMITFGGDAELEMVDTYDPFSEGIVLNIRPPKKTWKNITNLSGGEKTLSSLALVFALHYYKPSPLYFMDEIDAALDFKNVSIVGNYIKERTKNAQFIIISLRNNMFELADLLVGIYKTDNITKSAALDLQHFSIQYDRQHVHKNIHPQNNLEAQSERLFDELQQNTTQNNDNRIMVAQNLQC